MTKACLRRFLDRSSILFSASVSCQGFALVLVQVIMETVQRFCCEDTHVCTAAITSDVLCCVSSIYSDLVVQKPMTTTAV